MSKQYIDLSDPDAKPITPALNPTFKGSQLHGAMTDESLAAHGLTPFAAPPVVPPTQEELDAALLARIDKIPGMRSLCGKICTEWATTGLPLQPDWDTAIEALDAAATAETDPTARLTLVQTGTKLLAMRVQLADLGGTWEMVQLLAGQG